MIIVKNPLYSYKSQPFIITEIINFYYSSNRNPNKSHIGHIYPIKKECSENIHKMTENVQFA